MENTEKAKIMQWHYSQLGQDAPFMLRATGKFEWQEGFKAPTNAKLLKWKIEMESYQLSIKYIADREAEYQKEGCTEKAMRIALWEKIVENRSEAADALEIKRQAVKIRIPKPE